MATAPSRADAALVRRLHERDRTAWEELYAEYGPRLRSFAYRLTGNGHDADDLVQETFVRALPRLDQLDPDTVELGPYLFTTLRNLFLKSVERGQRVAPVEEVPEPREPAPIEDDPERSTLLHRQQEEVRLANARLAPRQRLVLALRELEDRSYAEIGVVVGLNENAVAQLISRARESLRTELRLAQVDPQRLPEECRHYLPLLSRHLDGQLRGPQLEATLAHLEGCERCQDALDSMREAQRRYRIFVPPIGDDEAHAARIDAELTAAGYWAGGGRRGLARAGRRGLVAVGVVALLLAGGAGVGAAMLVTDDEPSAGAALARTTSVEPTTRGTAPPPDPGTTTAPAGPTTKPATTTAPPPSTTSGGGTTSTAPPATGTTEPPPTTAPPTVTTSPPTTAPKPRPKPKPRTTTTPGPPPPDTIAPTVTVTSHPPASTPDTGASFAFRASESRSTFACRLDGAAFAGCSTPQAYAALAPGEHAFSVRARDRAGNVGPAATVRWTVVRPDTTPPTVTITSASTGGDGATFAFGASEAGSVFGCSLDGAAFSSCTSPAAYAGLAPGSHTFAVHATDAAGNTGDPATHTWTIAPPLPDLVVSSLTETGFTVTNTGTAAAGPFVVSVTLIGTFSIPGLAPGQSATRVWSACRRGTLTAIADRGQAVAESNERNNARSLVSDC
jgi:RNA polymerase sigma factor (sigma-70 family)